MKKLFYNHISAAAALLLLLASPACVDEVDLPRPFITPETEAIVAPAVGAVFNIGVEANCQWEASVDSDGASWIAVPETKTTGNGIISLTVTKNNGGAERYASVTIRDSKNSIVKSVSLRQAPKSGDGITAISDLRGALAFGNVSFGEGMKIRGIVVSDLRNGNFLPDMMAIEDDTEPGSGIAVKIDSQLYLSAGEEVEVDLSGASFENGSGMLVAVPESDSKISRTESSRIEPKAIEVSIRDLDNGSYESMYVGIRSQISFRDLRKENISENVSIQDEAGSTLPLHISGDCLFADLPVPTGGGTVAGIAGTVDGENTLMPCSPADIALSSSRFDGGVMLPYVFSFMTEGANSKGRYVDFRADASDANRTVIEAADGTGSLLSVNLSAKSKTFYFWNENSGHHNLQLASWLDGSKNYVQVAFPLGQELTQGFRLDFGLAAQKNAPADWEIQYSADAKNWTTVLGKVTIPKGQVFGGGKGYFYYSVEAPLNAPIASKSTLYIRLRPAGTVSVTGGAISDGYGRIALHSCIVLSAMGSEPTSRPSDAIWFEAFDALTQGTDYRLGDRLAAMLNYCGGDIADWNAATPGFSGTNVRQRPGYAQIGFVESQTVNQTKYTCKPGNLLSPPFGAAGNFKIRFKAMAYKNTSVFTSGNNTAADIDGDATSAILEVVGSGTINGKRSVEISSMGYSTFKTYTFEIENADADTRLRFSSDSSKGKFSRWFIDEICLSK